MIRLVRLLGVGDRGLVIVLEDLHWADPDTLAVLEFLADNIGGERVLLLATSRDEPASPAAGLARRLAARRAALHLALDRLDADEVERMVRACVADADDQLVVRAQLAADGVPFLVEEVLATSGVPQSFAETVQARLAAFTPGERLVLAAAALLGRSFDWQLLGAAAGTEAGVVSAALERGVASQLLTVGGEVFRFRHALTREAVAATLLPPARQSLAAAALAAVEAAHPGMDGPWRDVAADLAAQAADTGRAGVLLAGSGEAALDRGALATAAGTLRRAVAPLPDPDDRARAEGLLLGCLALTGHADEALRLGERLIASAGPRGGPSPADVHIELAGAAIEATRWPAAGAHLEPRGGWTRRIRGRDAGRTSRYSPPSSRSPATTSARPGSSPQRSSERPAQARGCAARRWRSPAGSPGCATSAPRARPSRARCGSPKPRTCRSGGCGRCTSLARSICSTTGGPSC